MTGGPSTGPREQTGEHHAASHRTTAEGQAWVASTVESMSLDQLLGQLFVQYVYGATATTADPRNVAIFGVETPAAAIEKYHLGGIVYFGWSDNLRDPAQIAALSNDLQAAVPRGRGGGRIPLHIAVDQEMGAVTRIGPPLTQFPGSMALGATRDPHLARSAAAVTGRELRALGITLDYAPDADVNVNPLNPVIGVRSFGSRPEFVADLVRAQVLGYQDEGGVSAVVKHFPGHGDTAVDSHLGLPVITHDGTEWAAIDAPPFRAAIGAGVDMVMSAHLVLPAFDATGDPATLSRPILTGLLRNTLGYDGVITTDSLEMQGVRESYGDGEVAVRALAAGADHLLMTPVMDSALTAIHAALASGRLTVGHLRDKVGRILTVKYRRGLVGAAPVDIAALPTLIGTPAHQAVAAAIGERSITVVRNEARLLPLAPRGRRLLVTGCGATLPATATLLREAGATVTVRETGRDPAPDEITAAVAEARAVDLVIVCTDRAWAAPAQSDYVNALVGSGQPVVVVALRDPYDLMRCPEVSTYVCTYSDAPGCAAALVRVLTGAVRPTGTLPVDIPDSADAGRVLVPYGHGLTW